MTTEDKDHDHDRDQPTLSDLVDLDEEWEAQAPPGDFAEKVLLRIRDEGRSEKISDPITKKKSRRRWVAAVTGGVATLAIAAAVLLRVSGGPPSQGDVIAKDRIEVPLGSRALAVLEPDAHVKWNGDDVVQSEGDVFYRVEPGAKFTVHTPAGDVEVKGTCFAVKVRAVKEDSTVMQKRDLKSGAVGAALSALAFVAVYEGKVAVSHASDRVDLKAGEAAQTGADGVKRMGAAGAAGEKAFEDNAAAADDPTNKANANLVRQVGEYRSRLEAIAKQKNELEEKLKRSEATLAASQDGSAAPPHHDFDLGTEDWKELAKEGTVKYQMPCVDAKGEGWTPDAAKLNALGLSPGDASTIKSAYGRSSQRVWGQIKPLCAAAIGSAEVANKIGPDTCLFLILDVDSERDPEASNKARREVAEIRAGIKPMPGPNENVSPSVKVFLAATGASKTFEEDLAQSFGPEEAHRLVYSNELCMGAHIHGGGKKKKPPTP